MKKTFFYEGLPVFYRVLGKGDPVVFLHGFAEDGEIWNQQLPFLENVHQLIIPDLPGSGLSELGDDVSMEGMAAAVKAMLDEEKITKTIMIGHSMGGYVTLAFAEKYPHLLNAFGLFHSSAYPDNEEKRVSRKKNISFIESHGTYEFLKQSIPGLFSDDFKKRHPKVVEDIIQQYQHFNPRSLCAYYEAMMKRPDRTNVLRNFIEPILFIIGKHDNAIPFEDSLRLCHLPALSYIHILENSGHMGMFEETQKCNEILVKFLQDTPH